MIYTYERFSILMVEDNTFMKSMIYTALNCLGFGTIKTASDGGEAIEVLKLMANDPMKAGLMNVDMILCNWHMDPINGGQLLKWVRRSKESPDRFMPFIMISGSVDKDIIYEARDLGVTEFLAKPFSPSSIAEKILSVIERPRPFVRSREYFGPDRRRRDLNYDGPDKREAADDEMEIVYEN